MRDTFFYSMLIEPFENGETLEIILSVIVWVILLFLLGLLGYGIFYTIDSVALSEKQNTGIVIDKWYESQHQTISYVYSGKTQIPIVHTIPESYNIKIKINNKTDNFSLNQTEWNNIKLNQKVNCKYKSGRISKDIYIKSISW